MGVQSGDLDYHRYTPIARSHERLERRSRAQCDLSVADLGDTSDASAIGIFSQILARSFQYNPAVNVKMTLIATEANNAARRCSFTADHHT